MQEWSRAVDVGQKLSNSAIRVAGMSKNYLRTNRTILLFFGLLLALLIYQLPAFAAPKGSTQPAILRPNPDLVVKSVTGYCEKKSNGNWVLKVAVTIRNQTGTPTQSSFVTAVGSRAVNVKIKNYTKTVGMTLGEHTTGAGFTNAETFTIETPVNKNVLRINYLSATVDYSAQIHEHKETNNKKVNSGGFDCVK